MPVCWERMRKAKKAVAGGVHSSAVNLSWVIPTAPSLALHTPVDSPERSGHRCLLGPGVVGLIGSGEPFSHQSPWHVPSASLVFLGCLG